MKNKIYMFYDRTTTFDRVISVEVCSDLSNSHYGDVVSVGHSDLDWMLFRNFDCINAIVQEQGNELVPLPFEGGENSKGELVM